MSPSSPNLISAFKASASGRGLGPWLRFSPLFGLLVLFIYAASSSPEAGTSKWSVFAVGLVTIAAALVAGAGVGFLFGLPKALAQSETKGLLTTNTNLDKVSDWLTTILVGLGLVQLGAVADGVDGLAASIAPGLGNGPGAETMAVGLLIYSAVDGFLIGYLWTRIVVSIRLNEAARVLEGQGAVADEALSLTTQPQPPPPPPPKPPGQDPEPPPPGQ